MTVTAEVEWDDETRALALALDSYEASLCPSCGRPSYVCQASDAEFIADLPTRCHATTALVIAQHSSDHDQPEALLWSVHEREVSDDG